MTGHARASHWRPVLLAAPALLLLGLFFVVPLAFLVRVSLYRGGGQSGFGIGGFYQPGTFTLAHYQTLLGERYFGAVWVFTLELALLVTGLCLLLGYPLALAIHHLPRCARAFALGAVLLPKLTNLLVMVYGLELLLGDAGPINAAFIGLGLSRSGEPLPLLHHLAGVVIGKAYLILPYAVLVLVAALGRIDPALVPAARGLGATPLRAFLRITLPLSLGGLGLAALISFIWAMGAFVSPYLLGSPDEITLAVDVQRQVFENVNWPRGAAEAVLLLITLAACAALVTVPRRWQGRGRRVS
ncbi:MAG TPA: ABC transporter permease [Polyangia bacterium]|jgi:ABC-type spermidine/putrescine transport system permease subunit I|nr:ABC transporter permease [Polyangia bacterium]